MKKYSVLISATLWSFLFLFGCVHQTIKMHESESLSPEELSSLVTDSKDVTIEWINDKKITTFQQLWNSKWNAEVSLKPDEYKINVKYWNGPTFKQHINSHYLFKLEALPGHTYQIKHRVVDKSAKLWIVDLNTSEQVGKVLASENEPITDIDTILDHSVYFKYSPPQNENWIIAYRNNWRIGLAKKGVQIDETYGISITLFELPILESKEAFLEFVKAGRENDTDPERFNIIKDDINYYQEFSDFCVAYHSAAEDKKAKKISKNKDPMILELAGYVCRHPKNKNIGVNFDFSHRYYKGNEDESLVLRVKELFKKLEL